MRLEMSLSNHDDLLAIVRTRNRGREFRLIYIDYHVTMERNNRLLKSRLRAIYGVVDSAATYAAKEYEGTAGLAVHAN